MSDKRNDRPLNSRAPSTDDMELAIHGLDGIFWALNMLVIHQVAEKVAHGPALRDGIDHLILAGQLNTDQISERF